MLSEREILSGSARRENLLNRPRRTRRTENLRRMVRETHLSIDNFIYPLFIAETIKEEVEIGSMPGVYRWPVERVAREAEAVAKLGIPAVLLFGIPDFKDPVGSEAYNPNGVVQAAVREIKKAVPELIVITDVCLCEFTDHGHCGVVDQTGYVQNDPTLDLLAKMALSHAEAGADIIAPSDMMDGRIGAIREALDEGGFENTPIMAYSAKYASGFYGPFREAADSAPAFGDRRSYQMDPPNIREALREVELDIAEGADMIMVKPALAYLDVIARVRDRFDLPLAAYNVSGEYSMLKAAARMGWLDEERVVRESLTAIKRAGADMIITYHAKEAARWLKS
ncbi:MAG: Porphobilinogen synthase [Chloroflexi bacterium]|jgi:porphobilinogen synthase|nr:Porphobilinogen synthase [Chloroflexota bacterium]